MPPAIEGGSGETSLMTSTGVPESGDAIPILGAEQAVSWLTLDGCSSAILLKNS